MLRNRGSPKTTRPGTALFKKEKRFQFLRMPVPGKYTKTCNLNTTGQDANTCMVTLRNGPSQSLASLTYRPIPSLRTKI